MPISGGIVWIDGQQSKWKGTIKSVCDNLQVPPIILLVFCLTAPDKKPGPGTVFCSMGQKLRKRKQSSKEGSKRGG